MSMAMGLWLGCQSSVELKVVYLVRHAEKDLRDSTDNPPLTPAGVARAQALATLLADSNIQQIFSTRYIRNRLTVQPLAQQLDLPIETYRWHEWQPLIGQIETAAPGSRFLICGHGDNLLPLIEALGAIPPLAELAEHEYDKLFRVSIGPDSSQASVQTFGP
jgi:2,3-bisphosphoglycerate-dependent phosphoglycerate mutase